MFSPAIAPWRIVPLFIASATLPFVAKVMCAAPAPAWETPPGWTETRGGAGGNVIRVTTLAAKGAGSFAAALAADGPRVIEFTVAGIIDLGGKEVSLSQPYITIAGETAPSPGITLTNDGMIVGTHDVIVRHIHIRPGAGNRSKKSGWEVDGLTTAGGAHDVIVDHCSLTWATDENLRMSGSEATSWTSKPGGM
jgi:hypothetical protein